MNRLHNLDYLRGLAASGIMVFHYLSWTLGEFSASNFFGRLGIYGVSIFYILSGLTLYYVYYPKMKPSGTDVRQFFKKRIFRIFPLLWLVTIASILLNKITPDYFNLVLNLTGLFGFVKWYTYFSTGIWSIGNELVFYVFFPLFILLSKSSKAAMLVLSVILFSIYIYFAFVRLTPALSIDNQWKDYINPLNQVFLFLGGFLIGLIFHHISFKNTFSLFLILSGLLLFIFYPAEGNVIQLVTGINRLVFTLCCFMVCIGFYKLTLQFPTFVHKPLTLLGEASYSVYLLHPLIYNLTGKLQVFTAAHGFLFSETIRLLLSIGSTFVISYFVYQYFEKYFMRKAAGKKPAAI